MEMRRRTQGCFVQNRRKQGLAAAAVEWGAACVSNMRPWCVLIPQPVCCQPQRLSQSLVGTKQHPARQPDQAQPLTGLGHQNSEPLCKRDACGATTQPLDSLCQSQRCERCCRVVAGAVLRNTLQRCPARCPVKPKAKACAQDTVEGALAARAADDCLVGHASGHDQAKLQSRNREPREVGHFKSPARRGTQRSMPDVAFDTRPEC